MLILNRAASTEASSKIGAQDMTSESTLEDKGSVNLLFN